MQLKDLVKPIEEMTDEELLNHFQAIRHRRSVERPAAKAIVERAQKKETRKTQSAVDKLINSLSEEDRAKLIASLGGNGSDGNTNSGDGSE